MPKRFVSTPFGEVITTRILDMRQDVGFRIVPSKINTLQFAASGMQMAVSPDQSAAIVGTSSSSNNFRYIVDPATLEFTITPSAAFGGSVYAVAISNTHYAIGGGSPFLYVFRRSDHGLETVSTTGLGNVVSLDFSPDGTKLLVAHQTGAGLRVYTVSGWTYADAVTTFNTSPSAACFSADGTRVVASASSSPNYVSVYSADLATRHFNNTTSSYAAVSGTSYSGPRAIRSPVNANHVLLSTNSSSNPVLQVDVTTGTITAFAAITNSTSPYAALIADPESSEDAVYVNHSTGSTGRTWTKLKCSTRTAYDTQPNELRMLMYGNGTSPYTSGYIIRSTPHLITGTVRDASNNPAARIVRAYDRSTGELMAQTTSDGSTGNYTLKVYNPGPYDLQFMANEDRATIVLLHGEGTDGASVITDNSLYGNVFTQTGASNVTTSTASPKYNSASLRFNGSAALRSQLSPLFEIASRDWSIDLQAKLDGATTTGSRHLFQFGIDLNNRLNVIMTGGTRKIELYTTQNGSGATRISGGTVVSDTWTHITLTKSGNTYTLYQDGASIGSATTGVCPVGPMVLEIGTQGFTPGTTDWFTGYIDDFRAIMGTARTVSGAQSAAWPNPSVELLNDIYFAKVEPAPTT